MLSEAEEGLCRGYKCKLVSISAKRLGNVLRVSACALDHWFMNFCVSKNFMVI